MALLAASACFACDGPRAPDAGAEDAGIPRDAHVARDAYVPDAHVPPDAGREDAGADAGADDDAGTDAGSVGDAGPLPLVSVSHPREMRAVWLSSVFRLDFPSSTTLTEAAARAELGGIVDIVTAAGLNTIYFQVRPESDALYASPLEPWSRFVSGTQGTSPGYDPLAILLELAHRQGVEVHAWINPFRGLTSTTIVAAPNHVTQRFPEAAIPHNGAVVMDPSHAGVRAHIVSVVSDITRRYDIDGVIVDDYFYPYPGGGEFPDGPQYTAYVDAGGTLGKSDWRRENVNALMSALSVAIKDEKPWARWGAAPFGIYRPGMPPGVTGLDAYEAISCDPIRWIDEGWVDYLAPQLYWSSISSGQPFGPLIDWWASRSRPGRPVIPSLALHKIGMGAEWAPSEFETQVSLTRAEAPSTAGQTWFRYGFLRDSADARTMMAGVYATPALPPVVPGMESVAVDPPRVTPVGGGLLLSHPTLGSIRGYAVYRSVGSAWNLERWVPAAAGSVPLGAGRYAVTAVNRGDVESLGVDITLP